MPTYAAPIQELIDSLGRLPGIGPKSAQRIAFYLLDADREEATRLSRAIIEVKDKVRFCDRCFNVSEGELCTVCDDDRRDGSVLCVVEEPKDVVAVERTGTYEGRYHVLGGAIDHLRGIGPDRLKVRELVERIGAENVTEGLKDMTVPLRVAVMGCVVNGPGEAREADLGVASGNGKGQIFVKGEVIKTVPESEIVATLIEEANRLAAEASGSGSGPVTVSVG